MLSNFFLKLNYFTRIVVLLKFHGDFFAQKNRVGISCMGNSLPAQQTIPRTKHNTNAIFFLSIDFS